RQYYKNCYIEGTVDFIFGWATAVFENCQIHAKGEGYITAASTTPERPHGLVFIGCRLTATAGADSFYLGRPWREHAKTVFIDCFMDAHIKPEGWHDWDKPQAQRTAFYGEYGSRGPGAHKGKRVPWARTLDREAAKAYTVAN